MAINNSQVIVTTSATQLTSSDVDGANVYLYSESDFYIGNASVTTENGFLLEKKTVFSLFVGPGEIFYGVVGGDSIVVYILMSLNQ